MADEPREFPIFTPLSYDIMRCKIVNFVSLFAFYAPAIQIDWSKVNVSTNDVADIVERVEKLKIKPFHHVDGPSNLVNVKCVVYFFLRMVQYVANQRGKRANITPDIAHGLCYAFRYRDLSKEALMHMAESLIY